MNFKSTPLFIDAINTLKEFSNKNSELLDQLCMTMYRSLLDGKKIFLFGNGGSASDCNHIANELSFKYSRWRRPYAAISLNANISSISSAANDGIYEDVFVRQLQALGKHRDIAIGLSTSGNSKNVYKAIDFARNGGLTTVAFTWPESSCCLGSVDYHFAVECDDPGRIQEVHMTALHILSYLIESLTLNEND